MRDFWRGQAIDRRSSPRASPALAVTSTRPTAAVRTPSHQLHHRPRRLHPARPRLLQPQAQRGQPARATATAPTTTAPGTAAPRVPPTTRGAILRCRARQQRNFLATLLLSQGVPMLLGGDELVPHAERQQQRRTARTAPISWFDWDAGRRRPRSCCEFTQRLIALRRREPPSSAARTSWPASSPSQGCPTPGGSAPTAAA